MNTSLPLATALRCKETLKKLLMVVVMMGCFSYAMVPLYRVICEVTGINRLQSADTVPTNTQIDMGRTVRIELDSNIDKSIPWQFRPLSQYVDVHPGEIHQVEYEVINQSTKTIQGQAIPSYAPKNAVRYFKKLECFCFTQQSLVPGEVRRFPVVFVLDPSLDSSIQTITLSYIFFEVEGPTRKLIS